MKQKKLPKAVWIGVFVAVVLATVGFMHMQSMHGGHGSHTHGGHSGHSMEAAKGITMELVTDPTNIREGGTISLAPTFTHENGDAVSDLMRHHARYVHIVIVNENLDMIAHLHPEDFFKKIDTYKLGLGEYPVAFTFPRGGTYLVAVDAMVGDGVLKKQFEVHVKGSTSHGELIPDFRREKYFDAVTENAHDQYIVPLYISQQEHDDGEYRVRLTAPETIRAGEKVTLQYSYEKNGIKVRDFVPYLDAVMHFAVVEYEYGSFIHTHGWEVGKKRTKVPRTFGPDLETEITFENPGIYQIFGQVKHGKQILVSAFMVEVQ